MAKKVHHKKKHISKLFFEYGIHLWLMVFTINVAVFYVAHFYSLGKTCFTPAQVQSDNRCLYIMAGKVYQKGTRNSPHQGHPCGTDVTSVVPPSHTGNAANYLLPNYLGDICSATTAPTAVPPKPTSPPPAQPTAPLAQPTIARPFSQLPPNVALPTAVQTAPTAPKAPTNTIAPTATLVPTAQPTVQPTITSLYTQIPPTAVPTLGVLIGPAVTFSFALPAPSEGVAPLHTSKQVTLNIYDAQLNLQDLKVAPTYVINANATFDAKTSTSSYSMFMVQPVDMGASVSAGSYHIAFRTNQSPLTLVKDVPTDAQGTLFHLTTGNVATETPHVQNVLVGDLNGDDKIDALDYAILIDCFGSKATSPTCLAPEAADLNNNGMVDGIDYNLLLTSIRVTQPQKQVVVKPTILPIKTTPSASPSGAIARTTLPTPQVKKKPTSVPPKASPTSSQTIVAGDSLITLSKVLSYAALFVFFGVAIFVAMKSRLFNALAHKKTSEKPKSQPSAQSPVAQQPAPPPAMESTAPLATPAPAAPEPEPVVPQQISQVFYVSNGTQDPATGQYTVTLTDGDESGVGYMTQQPPVDGYYTVSGNVQEVNGAVTISILTLTPALKPGTNL